MKRTNMNLRSLFRGFLAASALVLASAPVHAAGGHAALPYKFEPDLGNQASLQRGARNYMNYCAGCHAMKHLRYGRLGEDLAIPENLLRANLMFTSDKVGDAIQTAMPEAATGWFGQKPPDLTLETRLRGPQWVYNYLMTFYVDTNRPLGTNNLALAGASMPHVLWELQGWQALEQPSHDAEAAHGAHAGPKFVQLTEGKLKPDEYKKFVGDTVNFMAYAAEPGRAGRISTGIKVWLFLIVFTVLAYLLKREFWKDVH
jgi:ubiquinol-cytochrome c reductase cytochrome c1 subunit